MQSKQVMCLLGIVAAMLTSISVVQAKEYAVTIPMAVNHSGVKIAPKLLNGSTASCWVQYQIVDSKGKTITQEATVHLACNKPYKIGKDYYVNGFNGKTTVTIDVPDGSVNMVKVIRSQVTIQEWLTGEAWVGVGGKENFSFTAQKKIFLRKVSCPISLNVLKK
jgi:hypothetical protein